MAFHCNNRAELAKIYLSNTPLPWKKTAKHIGNVLSEDGTMESDLKIKRGIFINECMSMNNEFCYIKAEEQVKLLNLYNAHFTGFPCWSFVSEPFDQLMNSWNVNQRVIYDLPI